VLIRYEIRSERDTINISSGPDYVVKIPVSEKRKERVMHVQKVREELIKIIGQWKTKRKRSRPDYLERYGKKKREKRK